MLGCMFQPHLRLKRPHPTMYLSRQAPPLRINSSLAFPAEKSTVPETYNSNVVKKGVVQSVSITLVIETD